ncbi:hypothetical protein [Streptacidiphilus sp. EB129]|uniref:hypothetical protein n=1 Tax=Streptacidiphilus sp. EB129 TaxID=3156262 RepID=UPI003514AEAB
MAMKWWQDRKDRARQQDADIEESVRHGSLLRKAAGIVTVDLRCAEHTWEFICREASAVDGENFRPPGTDMMIRMDGAVTVPLSGPTLVVVLEAMHQVAESSGAENRIRRALASRVYINLFSHLTVSDLGISSDTSRPVGTLTVDDRPVIRATEEDDMDGDAPAYGYGEHDRPLATRRDQVAEDIRGVLRSGGCREFTDDHGGFAVEVAGDERGAPFLVAAADDDGDQKADVIRYTELLCAAGYRVEPEDDDPLSIQVWIPSR